MGSTKHSRHFNGLEREASARAAVMCAEHVATSLASIAGHNNLIRESQRALVESRELLIRVSRETGL